MWNYRAPRRSAVRVTSISSFIATSRSASLSRSGRRGPPGHRAHGVAARAAPCAPHRSPRSRPRSPPALADGEAVAQVHIAANAVGNDFVRVVAGKRRVAAAMEMPMAGEWLGILPHAGLEVERGRGVKRKTAATPEFPRPGPAPRRAAGDTAECPGGASARRRRRFEVGRGVAEQAASCAARPRQGLSRSPPRAPRVTRGFSRGRRRADCVIPGP